ncbi:MAG: hypothetical protein WBH10_08705 [Allopontixanthobacter sediminis]
MTNRGIFYPFVSSEAETQDTGHSGSAPRERDFVSCRINGTVTI